LTGAQQWRRAANNGNGPHGDAARHRQWAAGRQAARRRGTTTAMGSTTTRHDDLDGRHDNGDGRHTTATGRTVTRHDDGKGQQGNIRQDNEGRTGGATMKGAAARR